MSGKLRAVKPGEDKPRVLSVAEAARLNDHRELLVALRERIATAIQAPNVPAVALAALSRQLMQLSKEIALLDVRAGDDPVGLAAATADVAWDASDL